MKGCSALRTRSKSTAERVAPFALIALLLLLWQLVCALGVLPAFLLPSPLSVGRAFVREFPELMQNAGTTLSEAFVGLLLGIAAAFVFGVVMDRSAFLRRAVYPVLLLTQTVPPVAVAPLLVLWMGYGSAPKIALVFLTCFFPVTIGLLRGFATADPDAIRLLSSMGASRLQIFRHIKLPSALPNFFAGLRVSVTYALVGAVIAEWLGGNGGLGVYMTRVRRSYAFDRMFAVILLISVLSLLLMRLTMYLEKKVMPWATIDE